MRIFKVIFLIIIISTCSFSQDKKPTSQKQSSFTVKVYEYDNNGNLTDAVYKVDNQEVAREKLNKDGTVLKVIGTIPDGIVKEYYKSGAVYKEFIYKNGKPEGQCKTYYANKKLNREDTYINGKINGLTKLYDEKGFLKAEINYKDDVQDGITKIYKNGKLRSELDYKMGKMISKKTYSDKGGIISDEGFKDDTLDGICRYYYKSGKIKAEIVYKRSRLITIKYYFDGGKDFFEEEFLHGRIRINKIKFNINAISEEARARSKGDGVTRINYEGSNVVSEEWSMRGGVLEGVSKLNYENGKPWVEWTFKGGNLEGTTKMYFESGVLKAELNFKNNLMTGTNNWFYESGKIWQEQIYQDGFNNGVSKIFYESGNLLGEYEFKGGKLNGDTKIYYDIEGAVKYEDFYENDVKKKRIKRDVRGEKIPFSDMYEDEEQIDTATTRGVLEKGRK